MAHIKTVTRYHDISCGHRVVGHEGKCRFLHGHNYRVHFECTAPDVDALGRVIDFGVIKSALCMWVENFWDHKMLLWEDDPLRVMLLSLNAESYVYDKSREAMKQAQESIRSVPFNPTAENMAAYLLETIGPQELDGTDVTLTRVTIDETRKCSATAALDYVMDAHGNIITE